MSGKLRKLTARLAYAAGMITIVYPALAYATTTDGGGTALPWDAGLNTIQTDLQGPVAHTVITGAVIGTGLAWGLSEHVRHVGA
jgi:type IV secretory pathway VirB2 component (pilin)